MPPDHHRPPDIPISPLPPRFGIPGIRLDDLPLLFRPLPLLSLRQRQRTPGKLDVNALNVGEKVEPRDEDVEGERLIAVGDTVVECRVRLDSSGEGCARHRQWEKVCQMKKSYEGMRNGRLIIYSFHSEVWMIAPSRGSKSERVTRSSAVVSRSSARSFFIIPCSLSPIQSEVADIA